MKELSGKVAAITGAASGIGRMLARELARQGAHLALADVNAEGLQETVRMIPASGLTVTAHVVDVASREEVYSYAREVVKAHGGVHIIINNAGVAVSETLEDVGYDDFEWVMGIDFWGVVYGTKAFLPYLKEQGEGHIVNIASINGVVTNPNNGPYCAAKFAVIGFTETLIQELQGSPVRATYVLPGGIKTNIARNMRFYKHANAAASRQQTIDLFDRTTRTTAEKAARKIVQGMKRDKSRVLIGSDAYIMDLVKRLMPVATMKIANKITERLLNKAVS